MFECFVLNKRKDNPVSLCLKERPTWAFPLRAAQLTPSRSPASSYGRLPAPLPPFPSVSSETVSRTHRRHEKPSQTSRQPLPLSVRASPSSLLSHRAAATP